MFFKVRQDFDGRSITYGPISVVVMNDQMEISVFPNPSLDNKLEIKSEQLLSGKLLVYNSLGELVHEVYIDEKSRIAFTLNEGKGVYTLHFHDKSGKIISKKNCALLIHFLNEKFSVYHSFSLPSRLFSSSMSCFQL